MVVLVGPTGVGKSRTAVSLALAFGGEIINADSVQVYAGFDIGTDKPPLEDRKRVPHHLLDTVPPDVQFTAADFVREAVRVTEDIAARGRIPFVVGGTGLYVKALLEGLFPGPGRDPELRARLEAEAREKGLDVLFARLEAADPAYARTIRSRDRIRIIRALEVLDRTGRPISEHFRRTAPPLEGWHVVRIGLTMARPDLYRRIEERVDRMFERGLVDEVRGLLARGVEAGAPPFRGLGYRHVLAHLEGKLTLEEAKALTKLDTRHYAKRQETWFRKMSGFVWFSPGDAAGLEDYLGKQLE